MVSPREFCGLEGVSCTGSVFEEFFSSADAALCLSRYRAGPPCVSGGLGYEFMLKRRNLKTDH